MKRNRIRDALNAGTPTVGTHLFLAAPTVVEIVGSTGVFDYVEFLAEYAPYTLEDLENFCRAAELHDLGTLIKVDWEQRRFVAQRSVGAGFDGVLFADPRSAPDVADCVQCLRPDTPEHHGAFGAGARRHALPRYSGGVEYVESIAQTVVAVMIEKQSAVEQLDEILAIPGLDMVQWGPADYAMSIGRPGERNAPRVRDAERAVIAACAQAGVVARAEINSVGEANHYLDLGVRHFCLGYDLFAIHELLKDRAEALRNAIDSGS